MSTLKVDALSSKSTDTDLAITADGTGKVDIETGFKVSGTAGVPAADIRADAITGAKIADDAIDSEHYTDGSIDNAHIADDAIDSEHYADGSIDNAHIADDAIDSEHYAAGSIDEAHLANDAVTLAKMAAGTDGNLISYDTSGNPVAVATGSDGQVLTSAGAGAVCLFEDAAGGGAWTFLGSQATTSATNVAFTSLIDDSTYFAYKWFIILRPSEGSRLKVEWSVDNGSSYITAYNYNQLMNRSATGSDRAISYIESGQGALMVGNASGAQLNSGNDKWFQMEMTMIYPEKSDACTMAHWIAHYNNGGTTVWNSGVAGATGVTAVDAVKFTLIEDGNTNAVAFTDAVFKMYGLALS